MPAAVGLSSVETIIAVGRHVAEAVGRRRELPSASAGGGCTHTHTHTYSLRALVSSTGERRIHRQRRGRRQQRRQWEESWRVQLDKPRYKARNGMMHSASASLRPVRDHMRVAVCRV